MSWKIAEWICGGFKAERPDGELVFVYKRLDWSPSRYMRAYSAYEFRWHGLAAGRLTTENTWQKRAQVLYTLDNPRIINEVDLLEIAGLVAKAMN
ncbi:MAG: hypothetical protein KKH28_13860 [Elusimicrobia bacterium]|nr:hypothetical protein [Elusimicrobiota bacterium]